MAEFILPDLGEGVHEGQIVRLHGNAGDRVKEDDPFMEVETDKAAVEIVCPFTGIIDEWRVKEGEVVNVGDVMIIYTPDGGAEVVKSVATTEVKATVTAKGDGAAAVVAAPPASKTAPGRPTPASPAVRKLARSLNVDIEAITGTGPGGRVTRADVEAASNDSASRPGRGPGGGSISTSSTTAPTPPPAAPITPVEPPGEDDADQYGRIRRAPCTQARKTIAAKMAESWSTIPHVTDNDDADVTDLEGLRKGYPAPENGDRKITMLAFVIRAVVRGLQHFPEFNATFDADNGQIIYKRYINIAIGVHTERGLVAPVIRDADSMGIVQLADALAELADKARAASFTVNETRGGTYTISNPGAFGGSRYSTPIITPGQCAVLALGRSRLMPWVVKGEITPRLIMPLSHSFDHRLVDGGREVAFMREIITTLENPARLLL